MRQWGIVSPLCVGQVPRAANEGGACAWLTMGDNHALAVNTTLQDTFHMVLSRYKIG